MMQGLQEELQHNSTSDNVKYIIAQYDWNAKLKEDQKGWINAELKYFVQPPDGAATEQTVLDQLIQFAEMHKLPQVTLLQDSIRNCLSTPNITMEQLKLVVLYLYDLRNAVTSFKNHTKLFKITQTIDLDEQVKQIIMNNDGTKLLVVGLYTIKIYYKAPTGQWSAGPFNRKQGVGQFRYAIVNTDFSMIAIQLSHSVDLLILTDGVLKSVQGKQYRESRIEKMSFNEDSSVLGIVYKSKLELYRIQNLKASLWQVIKDDSEDNSPSMYAFAFCKSSNLIATQCLESVLLWKLGSDNIYKQSQRLALINQMVIGLQFHESSRQLVANTRSKKIYTWILGANQQWKLANIIKFTLAANLIISISKFEMVIFEKQNDLIAIWKQTYQKKQVEVINIYDEFRIILYINEYIPKIVMNKDLTQLVQSSELRMLIFRELME